MTRLQREHPRMYVEWTIFPAWPWRVADASTGITVRQFKSLERCNAWLTKNGYEYPYGAPSDKPQYRD